MAETIGGTVIQRSFIGRNITNIIHAATVPLNELGSSNTDLESILSEVLAIPRDSILREDDYGAIIHFFRDQLLEDERPLFWRRWIFSGRYLDRLFPDRSSAPLERRLLEDFVSLISSPLPGPAFSPIFDVAMLEAETAEEGTSRWSRIAKSEETQQITLSCLSSRLPRRPQVEAFYKEMLSYEIPVGQSPQTKGDTLLKLLETSRSVCVAPLVLGASPAISQLSQGNYVGALLTTGTASVMTLVLIGTVSVGSLIVQRVAQVRAKQPTPSE